MKIKCCIHCGFIKKDDKPNKPCVGTVYIALREEPAHD